jgi:hypothetical protein
MKSQLSTDELNFLARKGLYHEIAGKVQSPRARRPGATVSAYYVRNVLKGLVQSDTDTTQIIKKLANYYLETMLMNTKAKNINAD